MLPVASCVAVVASVVACVAAAVTAAPAALVIASGVLLNISLNGVIDGVGNAASGNSYANGCLGGYSSGSLEAAGKQIGGPVGEYIGGTLGCATSTAAIALYNNMDPYSQDTSYKEIENATIVSSVVGGIAKIGSTTIGAGVDYSNKYGSCMPGYTEGFGKGLNAFFSVLDDAITFVWGDGDA